MRTLIRVISAVRRCRVVEPTTDATVRGERCSRSWTALSHLRQVKEEEQSGIRQQRIAATHWNASTPIQQRLYVRGAIYRYFNIAIQVDSEFVVSASNSCTRRSVQL